MPTNTRGREDSRCPEGRLMGSQESSCTSLALQDGLRGLFLPAQLVL